MPATSAQPEAGSAKRRILDTAADLFYRHGYHAVGVDQVVEQAGVAKTTLYRHFESKDDLIVAYLEDANAAFWAWFDGALDPEAQPVDQLVGLFEAVGALATARACLGCAFQLTAAEFPEPEHPGHTTALAHKQAVRRRLRDLAAAADAADPSTLADGLLLLMDGAFAAARMYQRSSPAAHVADAARVLIDAHSGSGPRRRRAGR
ncbi:MAG: TetR/AcrR family transcriptional regulator [Acidimicrobiia bacterium]